MERETATQPELKLSQLLSGSAQQLSVCVESLREVAAVLSNLLCQSGNLQHSDIVALQAIDLSEQMMTDVGNLLQSSSKIAALQNIRVPGELLSVLKLSQVRAELLAEGKK